MKGNMATHSPVHVNFNETTRLFAGGQMPERQDNARPFLKWAGGKRSIIGDLLAKIPDEFNNYFEPFVGGGALFWNVPRAGNASLSDINFHLIITYRMIRDKVEDVISRLEYHKKYHDEKYYAAARERLSDTQDQVELASLFIYLNKTCYNGLYRVNRSGIFNVPIGRYNDPKIVDADNLRKCSKFLADVDIFQSEFQHIKPDKGDFVYFDPPYHGTFSAYDGSGFGDKEQEELADFCRKLSQNGVSFMLSNSDTPFIRQLYEGFNMRNVEASRFISCKGGERKNVNELIIRNYIRRDESA
jgi:DNA adenine methylase